MARAPRTPKAEKVTVPLTVSARVRLMHRLAEDSDIFAKSVVRKDPFDETMAVLYLCGQSQSRYQATTLIELAQAIRNEVRAAEVGVAPLTI